MGDYKPLEDEEGLDVFLAEEGRSEGAGKMDRS